MLCLIEYIVHCLGGGGVGDDLEERYARMYPLAILHQDIHERTIHETGQSVAKSQALFSWTANFPLAYRVPQRRNPVGLRPPIGNAGDAPSSESAILRKEVFGPLGSLLDSLHSFPLPKPLPCSHLHVNDSRAACESSSSL